MKELEKIRLQKESDEKKKHQIKKPESSITHSLSFSKDNEIEYLKHEVTKLKRQVACSSCERNPK